MNHLKGKSSKKVLTKQQTHQSQGSLEKANVSGGCLSEEQREITGCSDSYEENSSTNSIPGNEITAMLVTTANRESSNSDEKFIIDARLQHVIDTAAQRAAINAAKMVASQMNEEMKKLKIELARKEKQLQQLEMDKKTLSDEAIRNADIIKKKEVEIKMLEGDISRLKGTIKLKEYELKKEKDRAIAEEKKRIELEQRHKTEMDNLLKKYDDVKSQLGRKRASKNLCDKEIQKLRDNERVLKKEIEDLKKSELERAKAAIQ